LKTHTTYYSIILLSKWEKDDDRDGGIGFKSKRNLNGIVLLWSKINHTSIVSHLLLTKEQNGYLPTPNISGKCRHVCYRHSALWRSL